MWRVILILFLLFGAQQNNFAQSNVDEKAMNIPQQHCVSVNALSTYIKENFSSDEERIRAIYVWITGHISYDVKLYLARDEMPKKPIATAEQILAMRTGVCQGYTELFVALSKAMGLHVVAVPGYTKFKGEIASASHSWIAAEIDGKWNLYDPTWGAGGVKNLVFIKRFNNEFYKVTPEKFIELHMPFDPMYQLLSYPLSNHEFIDSKPAATKTLFNYRDSIKVHQQLSPALQKQAELRRLEAGGFQQKLLLERRLFLKNVVQSSESKNSFNEGIANYNLAVSLYNVYIQHKNKKFAEIADNDLKKIVDSVEHYIRTSRASISEAVPKTDAQWASKTKQTASIDKLWTSLVTQKDFVTKYLATDKEKRKYLFMR